MKNTWSCCVLMSTYNGAKYLEQQIESLLSQESVNIQILVRDDGSTDSTTEILDKYQAEGKLQWYSGSNLGPAKSFYHLVQNSPDADYYAFCDQDDVWDADKVISAITKLSDSDSKGEGFYFSQTRLVDKDLNELVTPAISPSNTVAESLTTNYATGCTVVFSKNIRDYLSKHQPSLSIMHDYWLFRICLYTGQRIVFDPTPHISYRQHESNAIGLEKGIVINMKRRLTRLKKGLCERSTCAKELIKTIGSDINCQDKDLISIAANCNKDMASRLRLLRDRRMQSVPLSTKIAIIIGKY